MFTGIIQEIGSVDYFSRYQKTQNLKVRAEKAAQAVKIGDSVSVNGVCLTVTKIAAPLLSFDVLPETSSRSTIGLLKTGEKLNIEQSLKASDGVSGHFVTGHVDCIGTVRRKGIIKENNFFEISFPKEFGHLVAPKGSVAVDGISLTLVDAGKDSFTVYVISHTMKETILQFKKVSGRVNLEFDILAKYAAQSSKA